MKKACLLTHLLVCIRNSSRFLPFLGVCFPDREAPPHGVELHVIYVICAHLKETMYSILDFIAQNSQFKLSRLLTACNNIAAAVQDVDRRQLLLMRSLSSVMVRIVNKRNNSALNVLPKGDKDSPSIPTSYS